ncbi:MAG: SIMPL domain-containing protein [Candidatus Pacebacteria bacterium]|nr:SIMPL domain-containing protein [Candidatus Paceibacterota bacterium]
MVFQEKYMRMLFALVLIMGIVALYAYTQRTLKEAQYLTGNAATISVSGEGEVLARPDIASFSFSVRAEATEAAAAQAQSAEAVNAILAYLKDEGIAEEDAKTQKYQLRPQYDYVRATCAVGTCSDSKRVLRGYEVNQSVIVKVRDTGAAGALLAGVGERGATSISELNFTVDEEDVHVVAAREKAIADAKDKAQELADDLGVQLVRIVGFNEAGGGRIDYMAETRMMPFDDAVGVVAMVPEMPVGENTFTSNVSITYEVK